jgi:hypothetical protein
MSNERSTACGLMFFPPSFIRRKGFTLNATSKKEFILGANLLKTHY